MRQLSNHPGVARKPFVRALSELVRFFSESALLGVRSNRSAFAVHLRKCLYRTKCRLDTDVHIVNGRNFTAGADSCLYHGCYILNTGGRLEIGEGSHLGAFCYVNVCVGRVVIGRNVAIGPGTKIIAYSNHYERQQKVTDVKIAGDITIGDNVLVGANCVLLPGTTIADNVVVGAGSVVKGRLEGDCVYAGVPCRKIKEGWYQ